MEALWNRILDLFDRDPYKLNVWGTLIVTSIVYWGLGGLYLLTDLTGRPKFLQRYRIQDVRTQPVSPTFIMASHWNHLSHLLRF